jgi:beta-lactamase class A
MTKTDGGPLREEIEEIGETFGMTSLAVAYFDYRTEEEFSHHGDDWFHAASTIKVPVLVGVFAVADEGRLGLDARVHVRNRFLSVVGEDPYRVEAARDAGAEVHAQIGKTMRLRELARQMIVTSSNLATNLLVDLVGIELLQAKLSDLGIEGVELRRGVEDELAFEHGINNRVTARGLVGVLRAIEERRLSDAATREMLRILSEQEFRSGIPAGLPEGTRVANKTGEISTVAHDAGLVYLSGRAPYAIALLTGWPPTATSGRREALASLSRAVYRHLVRLDADA